MSSQKRKLTCEDAGNNATPTKKMSKHATIVSPKAQKRPRSLLDQRPRTCSSGDSDSDFQDDADNDPDWNAETQSKRLSSDDEDDSVAETDEHSASTQNTKRLKQRKKESNKGKKLKKEGVKTELKRSDSEEAHVCNICQKEIKGHLGRLRQHMNRSHHIRRRKHLQTCDICTRVVTRAGFKAHSNGHAKDKSCQTLNGTFTCLNCLKRYDENKSLGTHRRAYCPLTAKGKKQDIAADNATTVSKSVQENKGEDTCTCDICWEQFECFADLQAHSVIHSKEESRSKKNRRQFVRCPKCDKVFYNFHRLNIHNTVVHINKGKDVYKCTICKQGFGHKSLLQSHIKYKHGEDRSSTYKCQHCRLIFETWQLRQHHIRCTHMEKVICEHCGKAYSKHSIIRHNRLCSKKPKSLQQQFEKRSSANMSAISVDETIENGASRTSPESQQTQSATSPALRGDKCRLPIGRPKTNSLIRIPKSERYECQKCSISFESKNNYVIHKGTCKLAVEEENGNKYHAGSERQPQKEVYACGDCPEIFNGVLKFLVHEAKHRVVVCNDCDAIVPDEDSLELHELLECPEKYKRFVNATCRTEMDADREFGIAEEIILPNGTVKNEKQTLVVCKMCNRKLPSCELQIHVEAHKTDRQQQSKTGRFECPRCLQRYDGNGSLGYHKSFLCSGQNLNPDGFVSTFSCSSCLEKFDNTEHLRMHQMVHVVHVTGLMWLEASKSEKKTGDDDSDITSDKSDEEMDLDDQDGDEIKLEGKERIGSTRDERKQTQVAKTICDSCDVEFISTAALNEHKKRVSLTKSKYPYKCLLCDGQKRKPLLGDECQHLQHKKEFKYVCVFCGRHFRDDRGLERHIRRSHDYQDKKECSGCHQTFCLPEYIQHVDYNRKEVDRLKCKCLACGKIVASPKSLDDHTRKYSTCSICWKHFQNPSRLAMHRKHYHNICSTDKKAPPACLHRCKHCNASFDKASQLSAHVKTVLEGESSESLLCSWEYKYSTCLRCGMTFTKRSDYRLHKFLLSHNCQACHNHFETEFKLRYHYQEHHSFNTSLETAETNLRHMPRIFKCKYCEHFFDAVKDKIQHELKVVYARNRYRSRTFPLPCEKADCNELLHSPCHADIHRQSHKRTVIYVSCRFCHLELPMRGFTHHARRLDEKCKVCGIKLHSTCHRSVHIKSAHTQFNCKHCGIQLKSKRSKTFHETGYVPLTGHARCSVCSKDLAVCQVEQHREHIEDQVKGKCCAYCLQVMPSGMHYKSPRILPHRRYEEQFYRCGCGETIQAKCQKELHAKFTCCKCNAHFDTYQDLITHLLKYNIGNTKTASSADGSGLARLVRELKMEKTTWKTFQEEETTLFVCLYCGEKVGMYKEMLEHKSTFKYECPQCKKHFRTPLEANHHFRKVDHEIAPAPKGKKQRSKKSDAQSTDVKKRKKTDDDILAVYSQQSVCDQLYKQERKQHSERSTMEFQIGLEKYSILMRDAPQVKEDMSQAANEVQDRDPVSASSEIPVSCSNDMAVSDSSGTPVSGSSGVPVSCSSDIAVSISSGKPVPGSSGVPVSGSNSFPSSALYGQHHQCIHCKRHFKTSDLFEKHQRLDSPFTQDTKGLLYTCTKCDRSFDMVCGLEYHIARMCKYCGMHHTTVKFKLEHEQRCRTVTYTMNNRKSSEGMVDDLERKANIIQTSIRKSVSEYEDSETDTGSEAEDVEVFSRNEVDKKQSFLCSKRDDADVSIAMKNTPTENENDGHMYKEQTCEMKGGSDAVVTLRKEAGSPAVKVEEMERSGETGITPEAEGVEVVLRNDVEDKQSFVYIKDEEKNDNHISMWSHKVTATQKIIAINNQERKSSRIRRKKEKDFVIMSVTTSRTGDEEENAMKAGEKCEFCLEKARLHFNKPPCGNLPCCQNDDSLKWMRCVCLHCDLELPTKCHINYHLTRYARGYHARDPYQCHKKDCRKHFMTLTESRAHSCNRCTLCVEITFNSENSLEKHTSKWHVMSYKEIPIAKDNIEKGSINAGPIQRATYNTTKSDEALIFQQSFQDPGRTLQEEENELGRVKQGFSRRKRRQRHRRIQRPNESNRPKPSLQAAERSQSAAETMKNLADMVQQGKPRHEGDLHNAMITLPRETYATRAVNLTTELKKQLISDLLSQEEVKVRDVVKMKELLNTASRMTVTVTSDELQPTQESTAAFHELKVPVSLPAPKVGSSMSRTAGVHLQVLTQPPVHTSTLRPTTNIVNSNPNHASGEDTSSPFQTSIHPSSTKVPEVRMPMSVHKPVSLKTATGIKLPFTTTEVSSASATNASLQSSVKMMPPAQSQHEGPNIQSAAISSQDIAGHTSGAPESRDTLIQWQLPKQNLQATQGIHSVAESTSTQGSTCFPTGVISVLGGICVSRPYSALGVNSTNTTPSLNTNVHGVGRSTSTPLTVIQSPAPCDIDLPDDTPTLPQDGITSSSGPTRSSVAPGWLKQSLKIPEGLKQTTTTQGAWKAMHRVKVTQPASMKYLLKSSDTSGDTSVQRVNPPVIATAQTSTGLPPSPHMKQLNLTSMPSGCNLGIATSSQVKRTQPTNTRMRYVLKPSGKSGDTSVQRVNTSVTATAQTSTGIPPSRYIKQYNLIATPTHVKAMLGVSTSSQVKITQPTKIRYVLKPSVTSGDTSVQRVNPSAQTSTGVPHAKYTKELNLTSTPVGYNPVVATPAQGALKTMSTVSASSQVKVTQPTNMRYVLKPSDTSGVTSTAIQNLSSSVTVSAQTSTGVPHSKYTKQMKLTSSPVGCNPVVATPAQAALKTMSTVSASSQVKVTQPTNMRYVLKPSDTSGVTSTAIQNLSTSVTVSAQTSTAVPHSKYSKQMKLTSAPVGCNPVVATPAQAALKTMSRVSASSQVKVTQPTNMRYVLKPSDTSGVTSTAIQNLSTSVTVSAQTSTAVPHSKYTKQMKLTSTPVGCNPVVATPAQAALKAMPRVSAASQVKGKQPANMIHVWKPPVTFGVAATAMHEVNPSMTVAAQPLVGMPPHSKFTKQVKADGLNPVSSPSEIHTAKQSPTPTPSRANTTSIETVTKTPCPQMQTPSTSSVNKRNIASPAASSKRIVAPSTALANIVSILPGGLMQLWNIILTAKTPLVRTIIGQKGRAHYVECHVINKKRYLTFHHPASHRCHLGALNTCGQESELKFAVIVMQKDENTVEQGGIMQSCATALVVEIGQFEVHSINMVNNIPGNYTYIVELTKKS